LPSKRRFTLPWIVEEQAACFVVRDHDALALAYVYFEEEPGRRSAAKLLSKDEARRIATNVDTYRSNCNVKLTAAHRLKPSSNAKSHEGSITSVASLQSMGPLRPLKTRCNEPPRRQYYYRANDCADETCALASLIPPDRLAKVRCYKSSDNPEHGRQDEPSGLILVSRI
jgi:hypothetical protein